MTNIEIEKFQSRVIELLESINWELEQAREHRAVIEKYPTLVNIVSDNRH